MASMGSTGEHDKKRRHFSSVSPTAAAAKKQPFSTISEDKKLDIAVLQFQNQKLIEKLEAQKVEYKTLENKLCELKEKQKPYDSTLTVVKKSWEELVSGLESCSVHTRNWSGKEDVKNTLIKEDGTSSTFKDAFLSRLAETGATQSSYTHDSPNQIEEVGETTSQRAKNAVENVVTAIENLWDVKDGMHASIVKELPEDGSCRKRTSIDLAEEVKSMRLRFKDFLSKHKSLARELQSHRDMDAKNKAELKRFREEFESTVAELGESNSKLAMLKAERDVAKGAVFPILSMGTKHGGPDRIKDKLKDLRDMESALKELMDEASCRLIELRGLHEERIRILQQLSNMRNKLKSVKSISSSQAYILVRDQIEKSKAEVLEYQALFEKLQIEKDILLWKEKEMNIKVDITDVSRRASLVVDSRINDLGIEIQKQIDERKLIETKLEEASSQPGRKEIIAEFRALVSSFPEEMGNMQSQLRKYKEAASDIHSLRADIQSLSSILGRKVVEHETLSARSADQDAEIQKLQAVVRDLKENDEELKLILEMYRRESTDSREVLEARDFEFKAWAHVQSLKSSLDEHNLELRVKTANEAEAISQQRLAAAEAEIADLRQKLEASKRDTSKLTVSLKSKSEENEAYLSEIESIGQAYDDMQTQNQHLLQQITERDDYNIKLVLEGVRVRQLQDALLMDSQIMERDIQRASAGLSFYDTKAARIEDQLRSCSDQISKLAENKSQCSVMLQSTQKRLSDVRRLSQQVRESLEESQSKVENSRLFLAELQIDLDEERFEKKRTEEELEIVRRKSTRLRAEREGSSVVEKLQEELKEYREILKCSICLDRTKEVVIKKCFHLFCNPCVQKIMKNPRNRKCPECAASFGPNDVKPVYIS